MNRTERKKKNKLLALHPNALFCCITHGAIYDVTLLNTPNRKAYNGKIVYACLECQRIADRKNAANRVKRNAIKKAKRPKVICKIHGGINDLNFLYASHSTRYNKTVYQCVICRRECGKKQSDRRKFLRNINNPNNPINSNPKARARSAVAQVVLLKAKERGLSDEKTNAVLKHAQTITDHISDIYINHRGK